MRQLWQAELTCSMLAFQKLSTPPLAATFDFYWPIGKEAIRKLLKKNCHKRIQNLSQWQRYDAQHGIIKCSGWESSTKDNLARGDPGNEVGQRIACDPAISSPEFLRLFVSGWSPGETLG